MATLVGLGLLVKGDTESSRRLSPMMSCVVSSRCPECCKSGSQGCSGVEGKRRSWQALYVLFVSMECRREMFLAGGLFSIPGNATQL